MRRLAFALRLRSPLWMAVCIMLVPHVYPAVLWITKNWRHARYTIPAEFVGDQVWVENASWPPAQQNDKVLVHNSWGTRIMERSKLNLPAIRSSPPTPFTEPTSRPAFLDSPAWGDALENWGLTPLLLHVRIVENGEKPRGLKTLETLWLEEVDTDVTKSNLGVSMLPWEGIERGFESHRSYHPTQRLYLVCAMNAVESNVDDVVATLRDSSHGQIIAETAPPVYQPGSNPARMLVTFRFQLLSNHRRPKTLCLERGSLRLALKLPLSLCGDRKDEVRLPHTDIANTVLPAAGSIRSSKEDLAIYCGAHVTELAGGILDFPFPFDGEVKSTVEVSLAAFFERSHSREWIQTNDGIYSAFHGTALMSDHPRLAAMLQFFERMRLPRWAVPPQVKSDN